MDTTETPSPTQRHAAAIADDARHALEKLKAEEERYRAWRHKYRHHRHVIRIALALVLLWVLMIYVVLPAIWTHYEHAPALEDAPKTTRTAQGIAADPINVSVVGSQDELIAALLHAGWLPADKVTIASSFRISTSVLFRRAYETAPMSPLYLWERVQDLAFQRPRGNSAAQRDHVRFWLAPTEFWINQRPLWLGAVTFDRSVGFSHYTGQITHHIAPDIDNDRDKLVADLTGTARVGRKFTVTGVGFNLNGRNGNGDWYYTDGDAAVLVLIRAPLVTTLPALAATGPATLPVVQSAPPLVEAKDEIFAEIRQAIGRD
jgi:hypothetical protein